MEVFVKLGPQTFTVSCDGDALCSKLQEQLQDLTGFFARAQKLIHKGKTLQPSLTLSR